MNARTVKKKASSKKASAKKKTLTKKSGRTSVVPTELAAPDGQFVSKAAFARWNGYSVRQVSRFEDDGMPSVRSGGGRAGNKIDSAKAQRWLEERFLRKNLPSENAVTTERERLRLLTEQANEKAIKNAMARGEQVLSEHVRELSMVAIVNLAAALDGLPGRLANDLAGEGEPAKCREIVKREVDRVRNQFADSFEQLSKSCEDLASTVEDLEAAAEADGLAMG